MSSARAPSPGLLTPKQGGALSRTTPLGMMVTKSNNSFPDSPVQTGANSRSERTTPLDILPEALERNITELDLAAYAKDEFTSTMERNVMKRMFNAFDVLQAGCLDESGFVQLFQYLGQPISAIELKELQEELFGSDHCGRVTFDQFWVVWEQITKAYEMRAENAFELVASDFAVPFHEQQLYTEECGDKFTPAYRVYFQFVDMETGERRRVSPWHDIPLHVKGIVRTIPHNVAANSFNFVVEIPKWTRAKFEIATKEEYNPIKQDMKNGVPRFYKHGDMMWNYGAFPQTWESTEVEFFKDVHGDNDPIDGIEIGMVQYPTGSVVQVKVLGVLGMIDEGQMDWKLIMIANGDPLSAFLNDIDDVPRHLPGCLEAIREWLRVYKICQGGVENHFAFDGAFQNKAFALKILEESHRMWSNLKKIARKHIV